MTVRAFFRVAVVALVLGLVNVRLASADTEFGAGSLIIPTDACFQMNQAPADCKWSADGSGVGTCGDCTGTCPLLATGYPTGSVKMTFGVAYLLATSGIPVHVVLSGTKSRLSDADFRIARPTPGADPAPVAVLRWSTSASSPIDGASGGYESHDDLLNLPAATNDVAYPGSPLVVDAADAEAALSVLSVFNRRGRTTLPGGQRAFGDVVIHISKNRFTAPVISVMQSRPRPVGILSERSLDSALGETGIPLVLDPNQPCTTNADCPFAASASGTPSGTCDTSAGLCRIAYWTPFAYVSGSAPASFSVARTSGMPGPTSVCDATRCTELLWDRGGDDGIYDRLVDTLWIDDTLGSATDWNRFVDRPGGLGDFLWSGGTVLGLRNAARLAEQGSSRLLTTLGSASGNDNQNGNAFCAAAIADGSSGSAVTTFNSTSTPFAASNPYLQTGGLRFHVNGGGGGLSNLLLAGPTWDPEAEGLFDPTLGAWGVVSGRPSLTPRLTAIESPAPRRAGYVLWEGAVGDWDTFTPHKDGGMRVLYNTLLPRVSSPPDASGRINPRFTRVELARSSLVGSPMSGPISYAGTFDWAIPRDPQLPGGQYYSPPPGTYPSATGHFRELIADAPTFGGDCTGPGSACNWDVAQRLAGQSSPRLVAYMDDAPGVAALHSMAVPTTGPVSADAGLDADPVLGFVRRNLGSKLGGIDYSTAAIVQTKSNLRVGNAGKRPTVAYFGGRDGLVHAICVLPATEALTSAAPGGRTYAANTCYGRSPGEEIWALMPRSVKAQMPTVDFARKDFSQINVGGIMRVADIKLPSDSRYHTVLFFTTRTATAASPDAIVALDISDPDPAYLDQVSPAPLSLYVLWENDGTSGRQPVAWEAAVATACTSGACALGRSAGVSLAGFDDESFYVVATSAIAPSLGRPGINTYLLDAATGKLIGFNQVHYDEAGRTGLGGLPVSVPATSLLTAPIPNEVPPVPTLLDPTGGRRDSAAFVADLGGVLRRFDLPNPTPPVTDNGLGKQTTLLSANSVSGGYNPGCPSIGGSATACQPIGASPAIVRNPSGNPEFFAVVATGGADFAPSTAIAGSYIQYGILFANASADVALGPSTTDNWTSGSGGAAAGLVVSRPFPEPVETPTPTSRRLALRVYGQPTVSGSDLLVQATTLVRGSEVQLAQPALYPEDVAADRVWGRGLRFINANGPSVSLDAATYVATAGGTGSVLVVTSGASGSQTATAYFMGATKIVATAVPAAGAANTTFGLRALAATNFDVKFWLGFE